ncbi:MAG: DNA methylase, partial [Huintestinicola sp.]
MERSYIAIDLKSFYASVECAERGLDPLDANLVVADIKRTEKTICLAVSPSLKAYGISGRARLFEVMQRVNEVNMQRRICAPEKKFSGESCFGSELKKDASLSLSYITAPPRMALYMDYSTRIYNIYLRYIAPEDIHVYSIDEVFIDVTDYLKTYRMTPRELAVKMIREVLAETGITATAGIGTNLYLCKVAMDIVAKKMPADKDGVRIAELDEISYRKLLWGHRPLTDFWRVGHGIAKKLEEKYIFTMGDIAELSVRNEDVLYKLFGVNAELLIDHAWGYEPCTIAQIKAYRPRSSSVSQGQVLQCPYEYEKAMIIIREMADMLSFDLVQKGLVTDQIVINVGYDAENMKRSEIRSAYSGELSSDYYGRTIPKHAHGTFNLEGCTSSARCITSAAAALFERISDKSLLVKRLNITANHVIRECDAGSEEVCTQLDLFSD